MAILGIAKARRHFSQLLKRVLRGETITITHRGAPVAKLVPIESVGPRMSHPAIVQSMRELRTRVRPDAMSVREMVKAGRRY